MKFLSTILFLTLTLNLSATNYYVGSGGSDAWSGSSIGTRWATLAKVNSFMASMSPGDSVLFARGEVFPGNLTISRSGSSGSPIVFGAYGTGAKPIITGFTTVSSWTSLGSNVYEASLNSGLRLSMLTVDGVRIAPGRWPNADASNYGYIPVASNTHTGEGNTASVTASALNGASGLVGSEMVSVANFFTLNREPITAHSSNTVTYKAETTHPVSIGFGIFFQNSNAFLDQTNEWYYNSTAQTLRIYGNPSGKAVKASTVQDIVYMNGKSYVTFNNLAFEGADSTAFRFEGTNSHITVKNCDINLSGTEALTIENTGGHSVSYLTVENSTITNTNGYAVLLYHVSNSTFKNNIVRKAGLIPGGGKWGAAGYGGVYFGGAYNLLEGNIIDSVGAAGLGFNGGDSSKAIGNIVSNYCMLVSDFGGLYTNATTGNGRVIRGNLVYNGIGAFAGTNETHYRAAMGIYTDEGAQGVLIENNTVYATPSYPIYMHQSFDNIVRGNRVVGNIYSNDDDVPNPYRNTNNRIVSNIMYSATQDSRNQIDFHSTVNDLQTNYTDSNTYIRPFLNFGGLRTNKGGMVRRFDPVGINGKYGWEANGRTLWSIAPYNVASLSGSNIYTNGTGWASTAGVTAPGLTISTESKLDGTSLKFSGTNDSTSERYAQIDFGNVSAGTYRIKFSMIGSTNTDNLFGKFGVSGSYYGEEYFFPLRTTRTENEAFITIPSASPFVIVFLFHEQLPFWIDNMEVQKVNATAVSLTDSIRLIVNSTATPAISTLGANYRGTDGVALTGRITLPAYSSAFVRRELNLSPSASAGSAASFNLPTNSYTLNGIATDPDGTIASYKWTQVSGPNTATFSSTTIAGPVVSGLIAGSYVFQVRATDNAGYQDSATVNVTVGANPPPVANGGGNKNITLPTNSVVASGSATDDGAITYAWSKFSGPSTFTIASPTSAVTNITGLVAGTYVFRLTVTDVGSLTATDDVQVTVNSAANVSPTANAGADISITLPTSGASLNGSASADSDGSIASYSWSKISGPLYTISSATVASPTLTGLSAGTYVFRLTVTDNLGAAHVDDVVVVVLPVYVPATNGIRVFPLYKFQGQ